MTDLAHRIRRALARAHAGKVLSLDETEALLSAREEALSYLMSVAARLRDLGHGTTITYSRKVFVPLTMLCRDHCHYCTFAKPPSKLDRPFLTPEEAVAIAEAGRRAGCKEALFTLGDRPEERYPVARDWLDERGYRSTLEYVRAVSIRVIEETGLLPHLNPGVMTWEEMARLKHVSASMGIMLETSSHRLSQRGGAHFGSPDKVPAVRLRTIEDAGRLSIPFTTGILIGIGETLRERAESLFAIRDLHRKYRHVQEVIVQNFRAKPGTAMHDAPEPTEEEFLAAVATARVVLGPRMHLQAPPNLSDPGYPRLIDAGIDDWGGVSPVTIDHVNPEAPWPKLRDLERRTAERGHVLRERLAVYPEFALKPDPWLAGKMHRPVARLAGPDGLAVEGQKPEPTPWQDPDVRWKPRVIALSFAKGPDQGLRQDAIDVYGDFDAIEVTREWSRRHRGPERLSLEVKGALGKAAEGRGGDLTDGEALALFDVEDGALEDLCRVADDLRREAVGDEVTYVVNRNVNFTNICYTGCRFCAFAQRATDADAYTLSTAEIEARVREAAAEGATEICMQGGIDPSLPATAYFDLARAVKRAAPGIHLHAFSPMEVVNGASRTDLSIAEWLTAAREAGLDSVPGTAAEILDDDVRWVLTKGKLPTSAWIEVMKTAHGLGIPSTSTMMFGHVDRPDHWVRHIRLIGRLQDETGGFTEFVPLPFVHMQSPIYLAGIARPGPSRRDTRAVHALARILLHGRIRNIQTSWVKLGDEGTAEMLRGGANDLGGTLMEETISRMAGSSFGSRRSAADLVALAAGIGRPARQRTTLYGKVGSSAVA
ncbi:MAG TPA: bifunctional FO biosynthesis protein CofGH [Actinomycetota bacterium]|nr:bifunctional FO biosynthesis protein CofGH [Actinomycetota bacterium]